MNDRFKFRYFYKSAGKYINPPNLVYNNGSYDQLSIRQNTNGTFESYIITSWNTSDVIPEQCTGLKDKNGKLIYEGDIVEVGGRYAKGNYKIIFDECDCEYDLKSGNGWFVYQLDSEIADNSEVIGNIHENADLLGERK